MDILEELAEARRLDAEARAKRVPPGEMERLARSAPPARGFADALRRPSAIPRFIAELKRASPSEGEIRRDFRPDELAAELEAAGAAALSVLC